MVFPNSRLILSKISAPISTLRNTSDLVFLHGTFHFSTLSSSRQVTGFVGAAPRAKDLIAPCIDNTVAPLAFNRVAQQDFEKNSAWRSFSSFWADGGTSVRGRALL
jgi:hypothetical protein